MTGYLTAPPVACPGTVAANIPSASPLPGLAQYVVQPPSGVAQPEVRAEHAAAPDVRVAPAVCSRCHGTGDEPETLASEVPDVAEASPPAVAP